MIIQKEIDMVERNIYQDIADRTGWDIHIGDSDIIGLTVPPCL